MADNVNRLLIVDEDGAVADFVGAVARKIGYTVASVRSGAGFVQLLESFQPSLIVMDLHLPDTDGVELLRSLGARACTASVVLMSGVDERVLAAAHELGVSHGLAMCGTLAKPIAASPTCRRSSRPCCIRAPSSTPTTCAAASRTTSSFPTTNRRRRSCRAAGSSTASRRSRAGSIRGSGS